LTLPTVLSRGKRGKEQSSIKWGKKNELFKKRPTGPQFAAAGLYSAKRKRKISGEERIKTSYIREKGSVAYLHKKAGASIETVVSVGRGDF